MLGVTLLLSGLWAQPTTAQEEAPTPKLALLGRKQPLLTVIDGHARATTTVVVANTGKAELTGIAFALLVDGAPPINACDVREFQATSVVGKATCSTPPTPQVLASGSSQRLLVTFDVGDLGRRLRDPILEAHSDVPGVAPVLIEAALSRVLSDERLWWPVWTALGAGIIAALAASLAARKPLYCDSNARRIWQWATAKVFTATSWSFTDSWATSVTALAGVLGTVLGATGFVTEVLPGVSAGRFTGFSLVFGALAVLAPIVYVALGRRGESGITVGTVAGLVMASAVTVAAAVGQLSALALLVWMSDASSSFQRLCIAGLVVAAVTLVVYAARSAGWLVSQPAPSPAPPGATPAALGGPSGYGRSPAGVP